MAEIDFVALVKEELRARGIDPNLVSLPVLPKMPSSYAEVVAMGAEAYRGGAMAICTAFGLGTLAPVCGEAGASLARGIGAVVDALAGDLEPGTRELFKPDPNYGKALRAVNLAVVEYYNVLESGVNTLMKAERDLGVKHLRNKWQILESLYNRNWQVLPVVQGDCPLDITKVSSTHDTPRIALCHVGEPGIPDFGRMPIAMAITGVKQWPEAFAAILSQEMASIVAQSIAEKQKKFVNYGFTVTPPSNVFVPHVMDIGSFNPNIKVSPSGRRGGGGGIGIVIPLLALGGVALFLARRK